MSDSQRLMSRVVAIAFFVAVAGAVFGFMSHRDLKAAEHRVETLQHDVSAFKEKLQQSEKVATQSATDAKTCAMQAEELKSRAETAEAALEGMKRGKGKSSRSSAS